MCKIYLKCKGTCDFSPKLRDKIQNGKPGFKASVLTSELQTIMSGRQLCRCMTEVYSSTYCRIVKLPGGRSSVVRQK